MRGCLLAVSLVHFCWAWIQYILRVSELFPGFTMRGCLLAVSLVHFCWAWIQYILRVSELFKYDLILFPAFVPGYVSP